MSGRARTVTAALLCAVVVGALAMIIMALPATAAIPEPIEVSLDFDAFLAGVPQTRTSAVDVPVRSNVSEAGVVRSTGIASDIEWTFELCQRAECRPLAAGAGLEPGAYTLRVSAVLEVARATASTDQPAGANVGEVVGRILLVESPSATSPQPTYLIWLAIVGLAGVALVAVAVQRVRGVRA